MELAEITFFAHEERTKLSSRKNLRSKNMKRTLRRLVRSTEQISICALSRNLIWHTRQIYASDNIVLRDPKTCPLLA